MMPRSWCALEAERAIIQVGEQLEAEAKAEKEKKDEKKDEKNQQDPILTLLYAIGNLRI
jgi:hypothetical protein